ncbi:MAG: ATP-grasp domain-containing protein [Alphaproteobacteria bacterium]
MTLRVLVCEYITGGGLAGHPLPPSLAREGDLMLSALIRDLSSLPGVEVLSTRDRRLALPALDARFAVPEPGADIFALWSDLAASADAVWPIAPETAGCLERLSVLALGRDRLLLGSRPEAVRVAASKLATSVLLARHGVPVVATAPANGPLPPSGSGWVVKPDDGVGAEETVYFADAAELATHLAAEDRPWRHVVQPFAPGIAASLSVLFRDGEASLLSCNRQDVAIEDGHFRYRGGVTGGLEELRPVLAPVAAAVAEAMPGLWGYAGIDLILTEDREDDGPSLRPLVLEVNPRLTTSYVGLAEALGLNPAGLVLELATEGRLAAALPVRSVPVGLEAYAG